MASRLLIDLRSQEGALRCKCIVSSSLNFEQANRGFPPVDF